MNCVHKQGLVPGRFPCAGIDYEAFLQKFCKMKVLDSVWVCVCVCVCVCARVGSLSMIKLLFTFQILFYIVGYK